MEFNNILDSITKGFLYYYKLNINKNGTLILHKEISRESSFGSFHRYTITLYERVDNVNRPLFSIYEVYKDSTLELALEELSIKYINNWCNYVRSI